MKDENLINFLYHYNLLDKKDFVLSLVNDYKKNIKKLDDIIMELFEISNVDFTKFTIFVDEIILLMGDDINSLSDLKKNTSKDDILNMPNKKTINTILAVIKKQYFKQGVLQDRVEIVLINFLKERKDELATYEQLIKDVKTGGLGLSLDKANNLLKEFKNIKNSYELNDINNFLNKISSPLKIKNIEDLDVDVKDNFTKIKNNPLVVEYNKFKGVNKLTVKHEVNEPIDQHINRHITSINKMKDLSPADLSTEVITELPIMPKIEKKKIPIQIDQLIMDNIENLPIPKKKNEKVDKKTETQQKEVSREVIYSDESDNNRPFMSDIKYIPSTLGPVEELERLTLLDFRRLSKSPKDSAEKILEKLQLLENDSFLKKDEGLEALRRSPLFKVYSNIMNISMLSGLSLEKAVSQQSVISDDEFNAIMNMNRKLNV